MLEKFVAPEEERKEGDDETEDPDIDRHTTMENDIETDDDNDNTNLPRRPSSNTVTVGEQLEVHVSLLTFI